MKGWNVELGNPNEPGVKDWFATLVAVLIFLHGLLPAAVGLLFGYKVRVLIEKETAE